MSLIPDDCLDGIITDEKITLFQHKIDADNYKLNKLVRITNKLRPNNVYDEKKQNIVKVNQLYGFFEIVEFFKFVSETFDFIYYILNTYEEETYKNKCQMYQNLYSHINDLYAVAIMTTINNAVVPRINNKIIFAFRGQILMGLVIGSNDSAITIQYINSDNSTIEMKLSAATVFVPYKKNTNRANEITICDKDSYIYSINNYKHNINNKYSLINQFLK